MAQRKNLPEWNSYYKENKVEEMPWYEKNLDPDLEYQINSMNLTKGKFQAIQLDKLGFDATGSDISKSAIDKAKQLSSDVNFIVDDFLNSSFPDNAFDFILDRGCFHVFEPALREKYLNQLKRILKDNGILFLKVMSVEEKDLPDDEGPQKFSQQEVLDTFEKDFEVIEIKPTVYYGTLDPLPKALFAVIKLKSLN